jgi:streptogramin lyase
MAAKYNPTLNTIKTTNEVLCSGEIYFEIRDSNNNTITDNVSVFSNFGILSSETHGGYFKGYLISNKPYSNVRIYAESNPITRKRYLIDTIYGAISEPQADKLHSVKITKTDGSRTIEDNLVNVPELTGIYSSCITCQRNLGGTTKWVVWVVDADREKLLKLNPENVSNGNMEILYSNFTLPENSSPSDITSDKNGNVWVTLYDSISTIRINNISNQIDKTIIPSITNEVNDYENTVTPASIDTDYENNVWISYSNQLSSFLEKYDLDGAFITHVNLSAGYQSTEILTDLNLSVWGIAKDLLTVSEDLSAKKDKIFSVDSMGNTVTYYSVSGSLWNLILDCDGNIWGTKNIDQIFKIDVQTNTIINFSLNSNSTKKINNYISDLEGITCTTDNTILVIDNINKKIHYFDASSSNPLNFNVQSIPLQTVSLPSNRIQDKINGYGDWNGFKYINKFQHIFGKKLPNLNGVSNLFTIYDVNSGKYDLRKVNENFDPIKQLNSYRFQDFLLDKGDSVFKLIETFIGSLSSNPNYLGKLIYERISNFSDNITNIDTCNVSVLKSMYAMLDETYYTFGNGDLAYPAELKRLIDIFSIKFSKLKGSRNKFAENFNNKGYNNDQIIENGGTPLYGGNKGQELDFFTTILTAGNNIVAFEKFSESYSLLNTNLSVASAYMSYIDPINRTFALSGLNSNWGWNLSLPEILNSNFIPRYYSFYEYLTGYDNTQTEGIINWSDNQTTIPENIVSKEQWDGIKENIINYALAKGLGIIK